MSSTERKLEILQHALGLDEHGQGKSYRSYFVTGPGSDDYDACCELVAMALMTQTHGNAITDGGDVFRVTDAGRAWVRENSPPPPKRTRSQRRYDAFLDADSGLPFGEWLRSPDSREAA